MYVIFYADGSGEIFLALYSFLYDYYLMLVFGTISFSYIYQAGEHLKMFAMWDEIRSIYAVSGCKLLNLPPFKGRTPGSLYF